MSAAVGHTAFMASGRWRIGESWRGEGWIARAVPQRGLRLALYRQRREKLESLWWGIGCTVVGVLWTVGPVLVSAAVADTAGWNWLWVGFIAVPGAGFAVLGSWAVVTSVRGLQPARDRIWVDDGYLMWIRWHPGTYRSVPNRVAVADIVEVRLAEGDAAVVVRTGAGVEHTVTDLGTASQRIGLATAIGAVVGPATTRIHPEQPQRLPLWWSYRRIDDGTVLTWRRPVPGYRWAAMAAALVAAVGVTGV